jgi:hypothetical protein
VISLGEDMKYYKIYYEVDTGYDYCKDSAIVKAENKDGAIEKLINHIYNCGYDHHVSEIFYVKEFTDDIFSSRFNPKK